jgi:CheY-like chemotaxis protein
MATSSLEIASALLVTAEPDAVLEFSSALRELCILPEISPQAEAAITLLGKQKFDAVLVDLQLGEDAGKILDLVRINPSNRTAVTFAIGSNDPKITALLRKKAGFFFERPLSLQSIRSTLKPAYGLILRERRRYFRYPAAFPVTILRQGMPEVRCTSVNFSEGGMALITSIPFKTGEEIRIQFTLPGGKTAYVAESRISWWKDGRLGVRVVSLSEKARSELHDWLLQKQEDMLPEFVARKFQTTEKSLEVGLTAAKEDARISGKLKGNVKFQSGRQRLRQFIRLR